ncbi:MAG: acyl--CoA ligase [Deltaproteobacteria bacterium]|nr:acyl--CoA ligase [Deltaproteobacteria bacterium]
MRIQSPNIIANSLISIAKHNAKSEYLICGNRRITWGEIIPRMFKISQALVGMGVKKADKVAFMFHNIPEFVEINAGIQIAGAIPVPVNYRFISGEIEYQVNHSDAKVLLYDAVWGKNMTSALNNMPAIEHIVCRGKSEIERVLDYEAFVNSGTDHDPAVPTEPDDVAVMIYTGGTTGFPKGVMLSYGAHFDMFSKMAAASIVRYITMDIPLEKHKKMMDMLPFPGKSIIGPILRSKVFKKIMARPRVQERMQERAYERIINPKKAKRYYGKNIQKAMFPSMPFFHVAAYQGLVGSALSGTSCYVLMENPAFDPALVLELVEREQIAILGNVPAGWQKLVDFPDFKKYDVGSVRMATSGGGSCPPELKKRILECFPNALMLDVLGQTEMTPIISFKIESDPDHIVEKSVGQAIVDVKIVDDEGRECTQGQTGEICYRSGTMMKGYYKDEAKTKEVMADGWFRSGDLGYLDENGELRTVDRKNECINTGGEKVFPLEVEEIIQTHPKVDIVTIIGVIDKQWGSAVRAVIQLKPGVRMDEKEVMDYCRDKMAGYKMPRSVVFVDETPVSPVGKVLRQKVRDLYGRNAP